MNKLFVFGDSWPSGEGLDDPVNDAFPKLVGNQLNREVVNLSESGTSIDHAVHKFLENVQHINSNDIIMFCVTGISRSAIFDNDILIELHPKNTSEVCEFYYSRMYTDQLGQYNCLRNMLLVQELAKNKNIKLYFIMNWDKMPENDLLDTDYICDTSLLGMITLDVINVDSQIDWTKVKPLWKYGQLSNLLLANHPTKQGHSVIAEKIINWLNTIYG